MKKDNMAKDICQGHMKNAGAAGSVHPRARRPYL